MDNEFRDRNILVIKISPRDFLLFCDPSRSNRSSSISSSMPAGHGAKRKTDPEDLPRTPGEKDVIQVEVIDTGGGIQADILDNIFNPSLRRNLKGPAWAFPSPINYPQTQGNDPCDQRSGCRRDFPDPVPRSFLITHTHTDTCSF